MFDDIKQKFDGVYGWKIKDGKVVQPQHSRDGASEKDIRQEKRVLSEVTEELEQFKERINSGCSGGC